MSQEARLFREHALRLWEEGFSVIPLHPRQKTPAGQWGIYQTERCSRDDVFKWWPDGAVVPHNIAVVNGRVSCNVSLDFDPSGSLEELITEFCNEFRNNLPDTCRVMSPSGGLHLHFKIRPDTVVQSCKIFSGKYGHVELRGEGSIIVMPPSVVLTKKEPIQLARYEYADGSGISERAQFEDTWLFELLFGSSKNHPGAASDTSGAADDELGRKPSAREIRAAIAKVKPFLTQEHLLVLNGANITGDRSAQSYWMACELIRLCRKHYPLLTLTAREIATIVFTIPHHREKYDSPGRGKWNAWHDAQRVTIKALQEEALPTSSIGEFEVISFKDIEPEFREPVFLINPLLPRGEITLLDGDDGIGKSWIWMALAAGLTGSRVCPVPYDHTAKTPVKVLVLTAEDDPYVTIGPRLKALGADLSSIFLIKPAGAHHVNGITAADLYRAMDTISTLQPDLLVVDHITAYAISLENIDTSKDVHVRRMLDSLKIVARNLNAAVLAIRHFRKGSGSAKDRGAGSVAYRFTARSHLVVGFDPDDPTRKRRIVKQVKMNLAPEMKEALVFVIDEDDDPPFRWEGTLNNFNPDRLTDKELVRQELRAEKERALLEEAKQYLLEKLSDGPMPAKDLVREAVASLKISEATLYLAKRELGILSKRSGFGKDGSFVWLLPPHPPVSGTRR